MSRFFVKTTLLATAVTAALLMGGAVSAAEMGYGFKPGLEAGKDYVTGQVIVGYRAGIKSGGVVAAAKALGGKLEKEIQGSAVLLSFGSERQAEAAIRQLANRPDVMFVERNAIVRVAPPPALPNFRLQKQSLKGTGAPTAQDVKINSVSADPGTGYQYHLTVIRKTATLPTLSTTPPTVAVIDTGVDYTHPDLLGKVFLGLNAVAYNSDPFDDNGHGTHVAGIIAANAANGDYGEGVCPNCKILAIKVLDASGSGTWFDVAAGMAYVRTGPARTPAVKVVNMSLGGPDSSLIRAQVDALKAAGIVLVAAAGNDNTTSPINAYPGADPDTALRVMATEQNDCRAWFSNFSPTTATIQYNIAAPGWQIPSTMPDVQYAPLSGTSMASPVVAGAAALVWGQLPTLTRDGLVSRLVTYGKPINCGFAATTRRVDVRKAITATSETALIGRLLDPFTGKSPSPPTTAAAAYVVEGTTILASDATNRGGFYEMTGLTAETSRGLKANRTGSVTNTYLKYPINILANWANGPYTDALPASRPTGNATITLDWKTTQPIEDTTGCTGSPCNGWEFDLYVKTPSGAYIDPYFNPGDLYTAPYVKNPRDSLNDQESAETVVIGSSAANGTYYVFADNWPTGGSNWNDSWTSSLASVQMFNGATPIGSFYAAPPSTCLLNRFWYVGRLIKNGTVYTWQTQNTCSNTAP